MLKALKSFLGRTVVEPNGNGLVMLTREHAAIHAGNCFSFRVSGAAVMYINGMFYEYTE